MTSKRERRTPNVSEHEERSDVSVDEIDKLDDRPSRSPHNLNLLVRQPWPMSNNRSVLLDAL